MDLATSEQPSIVTMLVREIERRFWTKVARAGPDECWEWQSIRNDDGYGIFKLSGRRLKATHVALELSGKLRPEGLLALHSCDNRPCCNPRHLRWGTPKENSADMVERGRCSRAGLKGEKHAQAKLSEHDVALIRTSHLGYKALAREYGVERTTIRGIKRRETWRHVP